MPSGCSGKPSTDSIESHDKFHGKYYTYSLQLIMEPGPGKISVGVMDQVSNETGFSNIPVLVKDLR